MSAQGPAISADLVAQMAAMCRALFGSPDADERRRARQALSGFSIAPQNVPPFLDVLQMTQDPYTLQFVLQSLRRIVTRHWKQLSLDVLERACSLLLQFLTSYAGQLPPFLVAAAAQVLARVTRVTWGETTDLRQVPSAVSALLALSPAHCAAAMTVWGEMVAEFGSTRPTDAAMRVADLSFAAMRRATLSFGAIPLLAIFHAAVDVLYSVAAGRPSFAGNGANGNGNGTRTVSSGDQKKVVRSALTLIQACLRYDFHFLSPDDWPDDTASLMLLNSKPWREALEGPALQQALWTLAGGVDQDDTETPQLVLEVVISILSYRSSSWTNTSAHTRALRHSLLGAMPLLAALASPDPADPSGEPLLSAEPELFTVAARLIFRVTSAFSWAEVTEAFNPAVPCPLRLVSLQSLGPRAMPGLHGGVAAAYDAGVQAPPGASVPMRPVTASIAVVDASPPSTTHRTQPLDVTSGGSKQSLPAAAAVAQWLTVTRALTDAAIAAAAAAAARGDAGPLTAPALLQLLAFWTKAAEAASGAGAAAPLQTQVLDSATDVMGSYITARFTFISAATAAANSTEDALARLAQLTDEPGYSEQLLSLALIARFHPTGGAHALIASLEREVAGFRALASCVDSLPAEPPAKRIAFAVETLACEARLGYLIALAAAVLTPDRLGGPRPATLSTNSLLSGAAAALGGVSTLRALFGIGDGAAKTREAAEAAAAAAALAPPGVHPGNLQSFGPTLALAGGGAGGGGRFYSPFTAATASTSGITSGAGGAGAGATGAGVGAGGASAGVNGSGSMAGAASATGGLSGSSLFLSLLNAGAASGRPADQRTRSGLSHALEAAEVVIAVTVWAVLPLLPVRLGAISAQVYGQLESAAATGFAALRVASESGGTAATVQAAGAGAGATAQVLTLLAAEIVPVDRSGNPVERPGWGPGDGAFSGVCLDGLPAPMACGSGASSSSSANNNKNNGGGANSASGALGLGEASLLRTPSVNHAVPPRNPTLDLALLAFARAFSQRYCTVSQLRHSRGSAAPVFQMIGETLSWIRPLPPHGSGGGKSTGRAGKALATPTMTSPASSVASGVGSLTITGSLDDLLDLEFVDEGTDWTADELMPLMFPVPRSATEIPLSPLARIVTFNARDAVGVILQLLSSSLTHWAHPDHRREPVLSAALELLHDMSTTYSVASTMWGLPAAAALLNSHTASPLGRDTRLAPFRRLYYECLASIVTRSRPAQPKLTALLLPLDAGFGLLAVELQRPAPDPRAAVLAHGLCTALHGLFAACSTRTNYLHVFEWAFPDYVALLTQAVEAWWGEADVLEAVLGLFVEMSDNRSSRIFFAPTSPAGVHFFKACALVVEVYCTRAAGVKAHADADATAALTAAVNAAGAGVNGAGAGAAAVAVHGGPGGGAAGAGADAGAGAGGKGGSVGGLGINARGGVDAETDDDDDDNGEDTTAGTAGAKHGAAGGGDGGSNSAAARERYSNKISAAASCLEIAFRCLSGGFCPLGCLEAFNDPSLDRMLSSVLGFILTIDRADVLSRPELVAALFQLLDAAFESAPAALLKLPSDSFRACVQYLAAAAELYSGFPAGHALHKAHVFAIEALSNLFVFTKETTKLLEGSSRDAAFARGGGRGVSRGRQRAAGLVAQLQRQVGGVQDVLAALLSTVLTQFVFETGEVRGGALTRVVLPFIYTCSSAWAEYVDRLCAGAVSSAQADAAAAGSGAGAMSGAGVGGMSLAGVVSAEQRVGAIQTAAGEVAELARRCFEGGSSGGGGDGHGDGDDDDGTSIDAVTGTLMMFRKTVSECVRRPDGV